MIVIYINMYKLYIFKLINNLFLIYRTYFMKNFFKLSHQIEVLNLLIHIPTLHFGIKGPTFVQKLFNIKKM